MTPYFNFSDNLDSDIEEPSLEELGHPWPIGTKFIWGALFGPTDTYTIIRINSSGKYECVKDNLTGKVIVWPNIQLVQITEVQ